MSNTTQRPTLFVIAGEAQLSGDRRNVPTLASLPPMKPTPPQQLSLHGVPAHPDTLISLGLRDLDFTTFVSVLHKHGVRVVLDLRVSSSFRGNGFSFERVLQIFETRQIRYRRLPNLMDRQEDAQLNQHVRQRRYATFLEEQKTTLADLRALIRNGPAVLLGWEPHHPGSDRAVLIDVLQRVSTERFELVVAP